MSILDDLFGQGSTQAAVAPPQGDAPGVDQIMLQSELIKRLRDQLANPTTADALRQQQSAEPPTTEIAHRPAPGVPYSAPQPQPPQPAPNSSDEVPARPASSQASPQVASASPPQMPQPGFLDRFGSNFRRLSGLPDTYSQNLTFQFLVKQGASPEMAQAMVLNPQIMTQMAPAILGSQTQFVNNMLVDKRTGKIIADFRDYATTHPVNEYISPATQEKVKTQFRPEYGGDVAPNGDFYSGPLQGKNLFKLREQGLLPQAAGAPQPRPGVGVPQPQLGVPPASGATPAAAAPQPAPPGAPAPGSAAASFLNPPTVNEGIYTIPPAPAGANRETFRTEATKKSADEMMSDQQKGVGAIEFLQQADQARQMINDKGSVIGRYATPGVEEGTASVNVPGVGHVGVPRGFVSAPIATTLQTVRNIMGEIPSIETGGNNVFGRENDARDQLNQMFTKLAQSGLKATYGSRVTNIDVNQQQKTVPHLNDQSAQTSLDKLDNIEAQSWRTLNQQLKSGLLNPNAIPPAVAERAVAQGKFSPDIAAKFPAAQSKQLLSVMPPEVSSVVISNMQRAGIDPATPQGAQTLKLIVDEYNKGGK